MKIKKWTLWLLVLALVVSLTACGVETSLENENDEDEVTTQEDDREDKVDEDKTEEEEKEEEEETETIALPPIVFQEFVAVDTEEFTVTVTEVDPDGMWGYTVKALIENKSADITYMFALESAGVDGVSTDPFWAEEVTPGNKAIAELRFSDETLEELGLIFSDIELVFRIYDTNDWSADPFISEPVHILPYGEEYVSHYVREPQAEDLVLVDNDQVSITVIGIEPDTYNGYTLKAFLVNKSADITYMMSVDHASIDSLASDPFWAKEVAPGKVAFADICFSEEILEELDLAYSNIELGLKVYDANDLMAEKVVDETVHIYPNGEENATVFVREPQSEDLILVDNENITLIVISFENDDIWGYSANVYIVNKTDAEVMFSVDSASVNGFMCDPFWAKTVAGNTSAFGSISWSQSDLDANGITTIEEIELKLIAYDSNNFYTLYLDETFTLNP